MPEYIINGDLYVKLKPDITKKWTSVRDCKFTVRDKITGEEKFVTIDKLPEEVLLGLQKEGIVNCEQTIKNEAGLYQFFYDGTLYHMINRETKEDVIYYSYEEIKEKFLNLYDFIKKGIFLFRTLESRDKTKPKYDAQLTYGRLCLLKDKVTGRYLVMDIDSPKLKGYDFAHFLINDSKSEIYQHVMQSIVKSKGKGR